MSYFSTKLFIQFTNEKLFYFSSLLRFVSYQSFAAKEHTFYFTDSYKAVKVLNDLPVAFRHWYGEVPNQFIGMAIICKDTGVERGNNNVPYTITIQIYQHRWCHHAFEFISVDLFCLPHKTNILKFISVDLFCLPHTKKNNQDFKSSRAMPIVL